MITSTAEPRSAAASGFASSHPLPESRTRFGRETTTTPPGQSAVAESTDSVNAEIAAMMRAVTHALRSPLWAVDGFTRMALEEIDESASEDFRRDMASVLSGVEKLTDLVNELVRLSRIARHEFHPEPVNLSSIATSILRQLQQNDRHRSVKMSVDENVIAYGDAQLLGLVLANIIGNAWKFTRESHPAEIEFFARDNVYCVRDNGVGLPPEEQENIFQPFHRFHSPSEYQGKGMGLAIVRRVVHLHGGRVWCESRVDQGATFSFALGEPRNNS